MIKFGLSLQQADGRDAASDLLSDFSSQRYFEAIMAICCGSSTLRPAELGKLGYIDRFCLGPTSHALETFDPRIRETTANCMARLGVTFPVSRIAIDNLVSSKRPLRKPRKLATISDLRHYFETRHAEIWPYFFSDLFVFLHGLLTPGQSFTSKELSKADALFRYSGFEVLFSRLIILRSISGLRIDRDYLKKNIDRLLSTSDLGFLTRDTLLQSLTSNPPSLGDSDIPHFSYPIEQMIYLLLFVHSAEDAGIFMDRLTKAYEVDETVIYYLNWWVERRHIDATAGSIGPHLIFLSTVLSDELLMRRFPFLFESYWVGGATADLESFALEFRRRSYASRLDRQERSGFLDFLVTLTALPQKAKARTFRYLFRPTIIERLASILTPPIERRLEISEGKKDEYIALYAQMSILNFAESRRILPPDFIRERRDDVRAFMRNIRYSEYRTSGVIRVNPSDVERVISRFFKEEGGDYLMLLRQIGKANADSSVHFSRYIAQLLAQKLCFTSKAAFDYMLSNLLRHGWLYRPLEKELVDFSLEHEDFPLQITEVTNDVREIVEQFNSKFLSITTQSQMYRQLVGAIESWLQRAALQGADSDVAGFSEIASHGISALTSMMDGARAVWLGEVRNSISELLKQSLDSESKRRKSVDLDQLTNGVLGCIDETAKWIAVNSRSAATTTDFSLRSLIRFEVENISVNDVKHVDLNFEIYDGETNQRKHGFDLLLPGQFLDVFVRLIDNTTQNAFRRSGYRSRTPLNFVVRVNEASIDIEIRNEFRQIDQSRMRSEADKLQAIIANASRLSDEDLLTRGRSEGGSGVMKILFELRQAFGRTGSLSSVSDHIDQNWFSVRALLPISGVRLLPHQAR